MMPFAGGIDSLSNGTLLLSAVAAFFYLLMRGQPPSWRRTATKTLAIALLAVLAAIEGAPVLLVAALALCAAGDAFLAQDGETAFLGGLASFLVGHLAYVALFVMAGGGFEIFVVQPWRLGIPALATMAALLLLFRLMPAVGASLKLPIALYVAAIAAMMWTSATVPVPVVMVGTALFLASDAILAVEKFLLSPTSPHRAWAGPAIWILYWLAQVTITLGLLLRP